MTNAPFNSTDANALNAQYALGVKAANLFAAGDEAYRDIVRLPVNTSRELAAFSQGWQSTGVD